MNHHKIKTGFIGLLSLALLAGCAGGQGKGGFAKDTTVETVKTKDGTIQTTNHGRGSGTAKMAASSLLFGVPGLVGYGFYHHSQKNKDKAIAALQGQLEAHPVCKKYSNSYDATVACLNSYASASPVKAAAPAKTKRTK